MTKEEALKIFPELANKPDDYVKGFLEAITAVLDKNSKQAKQAKSSKNNQLEQPPQDSDEENSDAQDSEEQESEENAENKKASIGDYDQDEAQQAKELRDKQKDSEGQESEEGDQQPADLKQSDDKNEITADDLVQNAQDVKDQEFDRKRKEFKDLKAQKDEINKWKRDPLNQFKQSVRGFFSEEDDERINSIAVPNTRRDFGDENQVAAGRQKVPKGGLPSVNIYFDQGNSPSQHQMDIGEQILSALRPYAQKRLLKINLFYFAGSVHKEDRRSLSSSNGFTWPDGDNGRVTSGEAIIDHIKSTHPDNVIIITDHQLNDIQSSVMVNGAVWMFFYQGAESSKTINAIKGRSLNKHWIING